MTLIWLSALILALCSAIFSISSFTKDTSPQISLSMPVFDNGFACSNIIDVGFQQTAAENPKNIFGAPTSEQQACAIKGFQKEPTGFAAIRTFALIKGADGDIRSARKIMSHLNNLSKRDRISNLWMVDDRARVNDVPGILKHYDYMLRTSSSSHQVLLPILANALSNDGFVEPFRSVLKTRPPWEGGFWSRAARNIESLPNASRLRQLLLADKIEYPMSYDALLVDRLVEFREFERATQLYQKLPGANTSLGAGTLISEDFSTAPLYPPLDWKIDSFGDYGASINMAKQKMEASAISNAGGVFAKKLLTLRPGHYRLDIDLVFEAADGTFPLLAKTYCAQDRTGNQSRLQFEGRKKSMTATFFVSSDSCRYHWLELSILPTDEIDGNFLEIDKIDLRRLN